MEKDPMKMFGILDKFSSIAEIPDLTENSQ